jgi:pSer/pThr/pTyr-binding forkhead associated (FHA) protein
VWLKGDDLIVKDLGSTNGTFLNEVQLGADKEGTLKPGQVLRLGQVELRYETGKKQSEQPRQTVRIGEGSTMVMTKEAGFGKKNNKVNKIFIGVGILLGVVTLGMLAMAFLKLSGSSN